MKKLLPLIVALFPACGPEEVQVVGVPAPQKVADSFCETLAPAECYLGQWFLDSSNNRCRCKRSKDECAAACGTMKVNQWSAFVCTCSMPKE